MTFKYIQFAMKPSLSGTVKFITEINENERPISMSYDKFKKFLLTNFYIKDKQGILRELDFHQVVFLDNTTGEFTSTDIYSKDIFNVDEKTLFELNKKKETLSTTDKLFKTVKETINSSKIYAYRNPYTKH